jgi:hypothetical protein
VELRENCVQIQSATKNFLIDHTLTTIPIGAEAEPSGSTHAPEVVAERVVVGISIQTPADFPFDIASVAAHEVPMRTGPLGRAAAHARPVAEIASPFTRAMACVAVDADRRDDDGRTCHDVLLEHHGAAAGGADDAAGR